MRYLMIVRVPEDADPDPQDADPTRWAAATAGRRLGGSRLRPAADATTVRVREGAPLVTHGPFVELAEQIAGFDLLEVSGAEEAVDIAAAHPMAGVGAIELRALGRHDVHDADAGGRDGADGDLRPGDATFLLVTGSEPGVPGPPAQDTDDPTDWVARARARGADRGGSPLCPADEAAAVRRRAGRTLVTHGPFEDLAVQVTGYHLIDVPDLDEAIALALAHPAARHGVVEIRPLWPF